MRDKPLLVELFCGLGAVSKVFEAEGWRCVGFDIERHVYGPECYPCQLVLQDVLTLHGSQFKDADFIWCSPPCQEFSYMAMPWSRGKEIAEALRGGEGKGFPDGYTGSRSVKALRALFDSCFRIQREASIAAGHHIPMVVENVKGAQPWVGQARANFGSFYLWGDIGMANGNIVVPGACFGDVLRAPGRTGGKANPDGTEHPQGSWFAIADSKQRGAHGKVPGFNFHQFEQTGQPGGSFQSAAVGVKIGSSNGKRFDERPTGRTAAHREGTKIHGSGDEYWRKPLEAKRREATAVKNGGDWFGAKGSADSFGWEKSSPMRSCNSKSSSRKAASAMIAKIPEPLSRYLAQQFKPRVLANKP